MWGADDCAADTAGWGPLPAGAVSYSFRAARVREETDVISLGLVGLVAVGAGDRVSADQNEQSAGGGERRQQCPVESFDEAIGLWVVCRGTSLVDSKKFADLGH